MTPQIYGYVSLNLMECGVKTHLSRLRAAGKDDMNAEGKSGFE
jgi:hypothetical protein